MGLKNTNYKKNKSRKFFFLRLLFFLVFFLQTCNLFFQRFDFHFRVREFLLFAFNHCGGCT